MHFIAPRVPQPETTYPLAKWLLQIVKSKFLILMTRMITLQLIVVLFCLHFKWSNGKLEHRDTPHSNLIGYRSHIDHMESH